MNMKVWNVVKVISYNWERELFECHKGTEFLGRSSNLNKLATRFPTAIVNAQSLIDWKVITEI